MTRPLRHCAKCDAEMPANVPMIRDTRARLICCKYCAFGLYGCRCRFGVYGQPDTFYGVWASEPIVDNAQAMKAGRA